MDEWLDTECEVGGGRRGDGWMDEEADDGLLVTCRQADSICATASISLKLCFNLYLRSRLSSSRSPISQDIRLLDPPSHAFPLSSLIHSQTPPHKLPLNKAHPMLTRDILVISPQSIRQPDGALLSDLADVAAEHFLLVAVAGSFECLCCRVVSGGLS